MPMQGWMHALIFALIHVESQGEPRAVGDGGAALGLLQIRREVVEDVNRIYGTEYRHEDAFEPGKAVEIAVLYLRYWGNRGGPATPEKLARIWNGGPRGAEKDATLAYWRKVREALGRVTASREAAVAALFRRMGAAA